MYYQNTVHVRTDVNTEIVPGHGRLQNRFSEVGNSKLDEDKVRDIKSKLQKKVKHRLLAAEYTKSPYVLLSTSVVVKYGSMLNLKVKY